MKIILSPAKKMNTDTYITIAFCERSGEKLVTKGTYAKMARGEMVRYMAECRIEDPSEIQGFNRLGYVFRKIFLPPLSMCLRERR